jgi:hypothetical protein
MGLRRGDQDGIAPLEQASLRARVRGVADIQGPDVARRCRIRLKGAPQALVFGSMGLFVSRKGRLKTAWCQPVEILGNANKLSAWR